MEKHSKKSLSAMKSDDLIALALEQQATIGSHENTISEQEGVIGDMNKKIEKQAKAVEKGGKEPIVGVHEKNKYSFVYDTFKIKGVEYTALEVSKDAKMMAELVKIKSGVIKPLED